ncbi:multidrug efflux pump VmrA [Spiroplasma poulsonii]|uniref:Uncharacterized protein n=1 Tax=Spiroplasma poulsonii TaxID=2138 RepID=A0A2P6FEC0_9MOLU|nr:multidrug efflux pump VmrA [Spiroplasma poulsonii]PQM31805.1 hypothetical protein SMSRO_SF016590 [Spiroplasma poulsonii]PWF96840.1 hypothetical protein SMSE_22870 [Spiroplasma poulsonii]PWF97413.1 hypothetical protein SMH99_22220 [Spiroplasma poulsonii]
MIILENISKHYGKNHVLKDVYCKFKWHTLFNFIITQQNKYSI